MITYCYTQQPATINDDTQYKVRVYRLRNNYPEFVGSTDQPLMVNGIKYAHEPLIDNECCLSAAYKIVASHGPYQLNTQGTFKRKGIQLIKID